jgi:Flp pilus assembly protein CpaB
VAASSLPPVPDASTFTLLLTPQEVQILFLAEQNGKLRADLRGVGDQDAPDTGYTIVTQPELLPLDAVSTLPDALKPDGYKR